MHLLVFMGMQQVLVQGDMETFYMVRTASTRADDSKQLATFIQNRLYKAMETKNRGVKT